MRAPGVRLTFDRNERESMTRTNHLEQNTHPSIVQVVFVLQKLVCKVELLHVTECHPTNSIASKLYQSFGINPRRLLALVAKLWDGKATEIDYAVS